MISYLKGTIYLKDPDYIILETNGVGYKVFLPDNMLSQLSEGQDAEIFCSLQIRKEETLELYGVSSAEALKLFGLFRDVSGIGPKAAMTLSSLGKPEEIRKAIAEGNAAFFSGIKGIGTKKIQKLIVELTGKLGVVQSGKPSSDAAVDSLASLGFSKTEARDALSRVSTEVTDPKERIKEALRLLGRR